MTLGNHVFTRLEALEESILSHEAVHVRQWKQHGLLRFAVLYVWFHFCYGYWQNPFEVEARSEALTRVVPQAVVALVLVPVEGERRRGERSAAHFHPDFFDLSGETVADVASDRGVLHDFFP